MDAEPPGNVELVHVRDRSRIAMRIPPGQSHTIGSGSDCRTRVAARGVEPLHAELDNDGRGVRLTPCGDTHVTLNGLLVKGPVHLSDGDWLALGAAVFQVRTPGATVAAEPIPTAAERIPQAASTAGARPGGDGEAPGSLTVGRGPDNDVRIASPIVSRHHARLLRAATGSILEDLRSTNGTFVNGARVTGRHALHGGERVEFGSFSYLFDGETLRELAGAGSIRVDVRRLEQTVKDVATGQPRTLLRDIDLSLRPSELVCVFGTSGSGKSTLLDALNGRRPASGGHVLYNDSDLYGSFARFRATIGYVPQQDLVHRKISIRRALGYAARLRLPPDTSLDEIDEHVLRVLDRVGLREQVDKPIDTPTPLSGGQLKRVSVAVELVSNPSILFLDEATSGLDAGTDRRLMNLFAELARDRKTVVCVTHSLENVDACDLMVLLHRGRLVYFGPPAEANDHFSISRLAEVYELLEAKPADHWADVYASSGLHERYVADRLQGGRSAPAEGSPVEVKGAKLFDLRQAWWLTRRSVDLLTSDLRALAMLLLPAPALGLLIGYVWHGSGAAAERAASESQICFTLALSMIWLGCFNAAREIVKELPVYLRERSVNLELLPYVSSKLVILAGLALFQGAAMLAIAVPLTSLSGSFAQQLLVLFLSGMAGTAMGLAISAFANTSDKANAIVPLLLVPQLIFSNVFELPGTAKLMAKLSIVAFWAFDAMKATLGESVRAVQNPLTGAPIVPVEAALRQDLAAIVAFFAVFTAAAFVGLRLKDRRR